MFFYHIVQVLLVTFCLGATNGGNATSELSKLETRMGDLESHTHALEQKEGAVLASILSKLTQLEATNRQMSTHIQKLEEELENVTSRLNESLTNVEQDVSFEAVFDSDSQIDFGSLRFPHLVHNTCMCYLQSTGSFTAPASGTYQVWYKVVFESPGLPELRLEVDGKATEVMSPFIASKDRFNLMHPVINHGLLTGFHLVALEQGATVSIFITNESKVLKGSSLAAVLLH